MADANEKTILNFVTSKELVQRIDDFRFKHRFESRAEAARFLLDWALKQNPKP